MPRRKTQASKSKRSTSTRSTAKRSTTKRTAGKTANRARPKRATAKRSTAKRSTVKRVRAKRKPAKRTVELSDVRMAPDAGHFIRRVENVPANQVDQMIETERATNPRLISEQKSLEDDGEYTVVFTYRSE
jgi:hypothetical protein